ncbi:MAG: phosphatase PAP2 family protein [Candidatus Saccharimonadales bacterium]
MQKTTDTISAATAKKRTLALSLAFVAFWLPAILFSKIAGEVLEKEPISLDTSILTWIHSHATPLLDNIFLAITTVGNVAIITPITLIIVAYLFYKKYRLNALIILFSFGGAGVADFILKKLFQRDRPTFWHSLVTETGYSFPSGHAMLSSALILSIILILWNTRWRWTAAIIGMLIIFSIGLSRLYLGVHYPTDVIAGWSVSLLWVIVVFTVGYGLSRKFNQHRIFKSE